MPYIYGSFSTFRLSPNKWSQLYRKRTSDSLALIIYWSQNSKPMILPSTVFTKITKIFGGWYIRSSALILKMIALTNLQMILYWQQSSRKKPLPPSQHYPDFLIVWMTLRCSSFMTSCASFVTLQLQFFMNRIRYTFSFRAIYHDTRILFVPAHSPAVRKPETYRSPHQHNSLSLFHFWIPVTFTRRTCESTGKYIRS